MIKIGTWVEYIIDGEVRIGKVIGYEKDAFGEFFEVDAYRFKEKELRVLTNSQVEYTEQPSELKQLVDSGDAKKLMDAIRTKKLFWK